MRATHCRRSESRGRVPAATTPPFLFPVALCVVVACAPVRPPRPSDGPPDAGPAPTPIQLRAELEARNAALSSFQGQGRLEYEGPGGKGRTAHMVVVKAPDKVRIDFRSPFSLTYTVVTDGHELVAYDRGEKVMYRGLPTAGNIGRYTRVPVTVRTLALLLRGMPPLPSGPAAGEVSADGELWRWDVPVDGGGALTIFFDRAGLRPRRARLVDAAGNALVATFDEYSDVGGLDVAHEVRAELPDGGRVQLTYRVIWRDRTHGDNAFRLESIAGVRVVEMDE